MIPDSFKRIDSDLAKIRREATLTPEQELILKSGDERKIREEMSKLEKKQRELAVQLAEIDSLLEYMKTFFHKEHKE